MDPKGSVRRPVVPPETQRCVWMTAGVLSYQLCERPFDCDHCPLDAAMRAQFGRAVPVPGRSPDDAAGAGAPDDASPRVALAPPAAPELSDDRLWTRGHFWVQPQGDDGADTFVVRVGLEPGLASALPAVHAVVMPRSGQVVRAGQAHLWAIVEGGTFTVGAPLDGTVHRPNPALADRPHLATSQPLGEGWLYEIEEATGNPELAALMRAGAARAVYAEAARSLREGLTAALRAATRSVPALPDGGEPSRSVADMLGAERYLAVVVRAYAAAGTS